MFWLHCLSSQIHSLSWSPSYWFLATLFSVVQRLIIGAHLTSAWGCILYTDSWYTSIEQAKTVYQECEWHFCGTHVPTNKRHAVGKIFHSPRYPGVLLNKFHVVDFMKLICKLQSTSTQLAQHRVLWGKAIWTLWSKMGEQLHLYNTIQRSQ